MISSSLVQATACPAPSTMRASDTMTIDDRIRVQFERSTVAQQLTPADRIGVVVEGCPYNTRSYTRTVAPTAKRLGLTITDRVDARCFQGFNDFGGLAWDMGNAVLRLSSRGANKVVFVSGSFEGNLMLLFGTAAESQGYRPGYALTSAAASALQETSTPRVDGLQLLRLHGYAVQPSSRLRR